MTTEKVLLFICFIFNASILFAQSPVSKAKSDSISIINTKRTFSSNLKITDGASMLRSNDIVTNISSSKELSTFYKAIQVSGMGETFKSKGPVTIFAPTDQAFTKLPAGKLDTLLKFAHKYDLIALLTYHAIAGRITSRNIIHEINSHKGTATFITLTGSKLTAKFDEDRNIILTDENGGQSAITQLDIEQNNGLIHIINSVLMPKFKNI